MSVVGFASLPVTPSMRGISKALEREFSAPLSQAAKKAGDQLTREMASASERAARAVAAARQKEVAAAGKVEAAERKVMQAKSEVEQATAKVKAAELDRERAASKSAANVAQAEEQYQAVLEDSESTTKQVEDAERKLKEARMAAESDSIKRETAVESARQRVITKTQALESAEKQLKGAQDGAKDAADNVTAALKRQQAALDDTKSKAGKLSSAWDNIKSSAAKVGSKVAGFAQEHKAEASVALGGIGMLAKGATDYAAEAEQSYGAVESIFGEHAQGIIDESKRAADQVGLSGREYRELSSATGAMLKNMGMPMEEVTSKSQDLVGVGADLAATFGGTTSEAIEAIGSLMRGETDPIERYGVSIKEADIKARMAADGLIGLTGDAEKQARAQTMLKLLTEQTASAQGQFGREVDTAAHKQQVATAKFNDAKEAIGTALLPVVAEATDRFAAFAKVAGEHPKLMIAVGGAVATAAAGLLVIGTVAPVFTALSTAAAAAGTTMMGFVGSAIAAAAPILAIVAAVAAAGVALWAFFTKTETGREMWDALVERFKQGVQWISDAFTGLKDLIGGGDFSGALTKAFGWEEDSPIVDKILTVRDTVIEFVQAVRDKFAEFDLSAKLEELGTGIGQFVDTWIVPFATGVMDQVSSLVSALTPVFQVVIPAALRFFGDTVVNVWTNLIQPTWEVLKSAVGLVADILTGNFSNIGNRFSELGGKIMGLVGGIFTAAWEQLKAGVRFAMDLAKAAFDGFRDKVAAVGNAIKARIDTLVGVFRAFPGIIKGVFSAAGTWLADAGRNIISGLADGIRSAGSAIGDAIRSVVPDNLERFVPGLAIGGLVPAFARGGVLPRIPGISRDQRDPILGVNGKGLPIARVEPEEFIVNRDATKKHLPLLRAINSGRLDSRKGDLGLPGYADGGKVSARNLLDFAWGKTVDGKRAPRPLEGTPYVWGGGLLANWGDCSGAMSGLAAFLAGWNLNGRKFATGNEGSVLAQMGFTRGTSSGKNAFEVAYFNGGPWGGHTAGTIYDENGRATNVEMGGGRGDGQIGGRAAGSRDGQFTDRWYKTLASTTAQATTKALVNGKVVNTSTSGVTVATDTVSKLKTIDWGTASTLASNWEKEHARRAALRKWTAGVYDTGGIIPTGGIAINKGKPERVLNATQTVAFDKFVGLVPGLTDALNRFTGIDWKALTGELTAAWQGKDDGYAEIARVVGDEMGQRIADNVEFAGEQLRDMQRGDNIRAYLTNMSGSEGLSLADRVGSMLGVDGLKSTFGGVISGFEGMEDAAVQQVDAADALTQAERNLAQARAEYRDAAGKDVALTTKMRRRMEDAEKKLEDAQASGKADKIAKAEKNLKRVREDAAAELKKNGAKSAEDILAAQENVTAAENDYAKAKGVVAAAAQATGQAQIAMALEVAELAIKAGKAIIDLVQRFLDWRNDMAKFSAQVWANVTGNILKVNKQIEEQKQAVDELAMSWVNAKIKLVQSSWEAQTAQWAVTRAGLEGAKAVAEAESNMQAERNRIAGIQARSIYDMGLLWDSYHDKLTVGLSKVTDRAVAEWQRQIAANDLLTQDNKDTLTTILGQRERYRAFEKLGLDKQLKYAEAYRAAVSAGMVGLLEQAVGVTPELIALSYEVHAAQIDQQLMVKNAAIEALKATYEQQKAAIDLGRMSQDLGTQMAQLQLMQANNLGMSTPQAMIEQQIAQLRADNAAAQGKIDNIGNRFGRAFDWNGDGKTFGFTNKGSSEILAAKSVIKANNTQIAELEKRLKEYGGSATLTPEQKRAQELAARLYAAGSDEAAKMALRGSTLGDAERSLELTQLDKSLVDWSNKQTELQRKWEDTLAEYKHQQQLLPAQREAYALEQKKAAATYSAEAIRATNPAIRDAAAALANFHTETATKARTTIVRVQVPASGHVIDADDLAATMAAFSDSLDNVEMEIDRIKDKETPRSKAVLIKRK